MRYRDPGRQFLLPSSGRILRLFDAQRCDLGVRTPGDGAISVEFRPIFVPSWGAVEGFGYIVPAFTMATKE